MLKSTTIDSFFKRKEKDQNSSQSSEPKTISKDEEISQRPPLKAPRIDSEKVDLASLVHDLGLRLQI